MSDNSEYEIQQRRRKKQQKQLSDSSVEKTPKVKQDEDNNNKNEDGIVTSKVKKKDKSGTLFDYFKCKRNENEIDYPVIKKIEKEPGNSQTESSCSDNDELQPVISAKLPNTIAALDSLLTTISTKIRQEQNNFFKEQYELKTKGRKMISECSIPICGNVSEFDFERLSQLQMKYGGRLFDVIMMDPPWQLASAQPSRGVAIQYKQLSDEWIKAMPIPKLQTEGFIFVWAINAKYSFACSLIQHWGYQVVEEITWVKKTVNGKVAPSHGFYLQHAKESCIIGVKGNVKQKSIACDVIVSKRRGQSQKPEEIYQLVEQLVPEGFYLEIFGRRNNLRDKWVTLGNEL